MVSAVDAFVHNAPAGLVAAVVITIIALLSAAALAGKSNGIARQAADDGEEPRG